MTQGGRLIVISGPSGAGKSTLVRRAMERTDAEFSVSATTRQPREGEADGREYFFVSEQEFREMVRRDELLEWAEVFGDLYGTPAEPIRRTIANGRTVLLDIDVQGAMQVHETMPEATFVLVVPPDMDELARRLGGRGSETPEQRSRRLGQAEKEIRTAEQSGVYNHRIVNENLDTAVDEVVRIIHREQART